MKSYFSIFGLSLILTLFACKNESTQDSHPEILQLETEYNAAPNEQNFQKLINKLSLLITSEKDQAKKEALIETAINWSKKTKNNALANTFAVELIKANIIHPLSQKYLWTLGEEMEQNGKPDISGILFKGYAEQFPKDAKTAKIKTDKYAELKDLPSFIKKNAEAVFENPGDRGINVINTEKYIDICEAYALTHPRDTMSAEYLFRAAEMARALGSFDKTLSIYEWIIQYYPTSKNAPMALFLKGFTLENEYKQLEQAKQVYSSFLTDYPNHLMAKDVAFLLENIGKSDKEIMEKLEKK